MAGKVIVIEGIIAAGKTTLIRDLERRLKERGERVIVKEEKVNTLLLSLYITDMERYAFSFQVIMLNQRLSILRQAQSLKERGYTVLVDRGLVGDLAFAKMEKGYFTKEERRCYFSMLKARERPDRVIYLSVEPEVAMERLRARGNESEVAGYTLEYLRDLKRYHEEVEDEMEVVDWNEFGGEIDI